MSEYRNTTQRAAVGGFPPRISGVEWAENETAKAAEEMRRMKVNALKILQMAKVAPSGRP